MAEFSGFVDDTSTVIVAADTLINGVLVQNKSALPITLRISALPSEWDEGLLLKGGEALYIPAGAIQAGASLTATSRLGETTRVYAAGA